MSRTFIKTSRRLNGKDRTHSVTVEASGSVVLVTSRDESAGMPHLSRHSSSDPRQLAGRIGGDLVADGYRES